MQRDAFTKFLVEHTYWAACAALLRSCRSPATPEAEATNDDSYAREPADRSDTESGHA
jgi:hypothetical protein